jgi:hypothetical protein
MEEFKYVPGETDLYSLPNEILVMLLTRIEQDTIAHFREYDEELNILRFEKEVCNIDLDVRVGKICNTKGCKAKVLNERYHDDYKYLHCKMLYKCDECGEWTCDRHLQKDGRCIECHEISERAMCSGNVIQCGKCNDLYCSTCEHLC